MFGSAPVYGGAFRFCGIRGVGKRHFEAYHAFMTRERNYLRWLAACGMGAGALVGIAGLAGSGAQSTAARLAVANTATPSACAGTLWTTVSGTRVCLQSSPFAVDERVQKRLTPFVTRRLSPAPPAVASLPTGMAAFGSGASLLQVDRPCQFDTSTL